MEGFSTQQLHQSSSLLPYCAFPDPEPLLGFPVRSGLEAAMAYETSSSSSLDTSTAMPMVLSPMVMQLHQSSPPESAAGNGGGGGGGGGNTTMVGIQGSSTTSLGSAQEQDVSGGNGRKQKRVSNVGVKGAQEKRARGHDGEPPAGYIHVRARRGQATDYHSQAERLRRERISERMTMLKSLVPGCDKITGTAQMLDEIISYVQSLQNQVEFLSMKLASLNPMLYEFGLDMDMYPTVPQHEKMASQLPQELDQFMGQGIVLTTGPAAAHASLEAQGPTPFGQDGSSRSMQQGVEPLHHQGNSICFFQ